MDEILILEDDLYLRNTIEEELVYAGFSITATDNSNTVLDLTFKNKFDLYLFDIHVIGMDGFSLLKFLRESGDDTPCIFLTKKDKTSDVIEGFKIGVNDYVKKPFDMDELLVRIKRFLNHKPIYYTISKNILYYPQAYKIINNKKKIILKKKEGEIFEYFLRHTNQIISKEQILENVYCEEYITDSTFRGYINQIKIAIGKEYIRNIRGEGYIFETF